MQNGNRKLTSLLTGTNRKLMTQMGGAGEYSHTLCAEHQETKRQVDERGFVEMDH